MGRGATGASHTAVFCVLVFKHGVGLASSGALLTGSSCGPPLPPSAQRPVLLAGCRPDIISWMRHPSRTEGSPAQCNASIRLFLSDKTARGKRGGGGM